MRKVLVLDDGVIVGMRQHTEEEIIRFILDDQFNPGGIVVPTDIEAPLESTLSQFDKRLCTAFYEGVEAERDRANAEQELGEEVELVNPYGLL